MDPSHSSHYSHYSSQRTSELSDPAMAPIKAWIESFTVWTALPRHTRASILKRASRGEPEALDALCNHNLRLLLSRAVKQVGRGVPLPDLIQEGWFGLRIAVEKYQPQRGKQFSTMAVFWIDQKLHNAIVTQGRTIYLPHHASEVLTRVSRTIRQGEPLRADDQEWLDSLARDRFGAADSSGVSFDRFDHLLQGAVSIDKEFQNQHRGGAEPRRTLADLLPAPSDSDPSDSLDIAALLLELVNGGVLSRREGWLIVRHYGLDGEGGRTYLEMARELAAAATRAGTPTQAVSRQRIEQLFSAAMRKVRQHVGQSTWQSATEGVQYREQAKGLAGASPAGQSKNTASPKKTTARRTSVDSSNETTASRVAAPLPLRAHDSTKRAKGSSRSTRKPSGEKSAATSRRVAS